MSQFDATSGLSTKEIGIIKYNIKNQIARQLPELPDPVETKVTVHRGANAPGTRLPSRTSAVNMTLRIAAETTLSGFNRDGLEANRLSGADHQGGSGSREGGVVSWK